MIREPYTEDKSRIVLSFANANGGHYFVHWLRRELMKELNYFSSKSIYLDNVETRNFAGGEQAYHLGGKDSFETAGAIGQMFERPVVGPDKREGAKFGGVRPIGAAFIDPKDTPESRQKWFQHWQAAVREAKVIIQIQSAAYRESNPCKQEVAKINEAIKKRAGTLKLIIITTDVWEKQIQICSASPKVHSMHIPVSKSKSNLGDNYELNASDLHKLKHQLIYWGC